MEPDDATPQHPPDLKRHSQDRAIARIAAVAMIGLVLLFVAPKLLTSIPNIMTSKVLAEIAICTCFAVPWAVILAIAAITAPPRPLSETSILLQRVVWLVRAAWATLVILFSAVTSTVVALEVQAQSTDASVWDKVFHDLATAVLAPVALIAATLASATIPFQLWRVGETVRHQSVERLVGLLPVPNWLTRCLETLTMALTHPWIAGIICYMGPLFIVTVWQTYL